MKNKTLYNSVVGLGSQLIILALGFVVPRIIMTHYGSDVNGFTSTMSQIFTYMALLESGVTQSTSVQLYKYIHNEDRNGISYTMSTSRRYYRIIALIYFGMVMVLSGLVPFILKTQISYGTIFFYTLFEGLTSVVTFYSISLTRVFLLTNGKSYIVNFVGLAQKILLYGIKIVLSLINLNIVFIQVGYFVVSLIQLAAYSIYMKKEYSWIDYKAAPKTAKLPDRFSFLITEISYTIFSSTDMVVLSIFVSTALSSVYSTYNMVFIAIETLITSVYNSVKYNLGQTYQKSLKDYCRLHDLYHSAFLGICTALMCVTYFLLLPFVRLYTRGVVDINYEYQWLPLMFCLVRLLSRSRSIAGNISGIAGYAKPVSYVSLAEAFLNVLLSVLLVQRFSIYGVLLATVVSLPLKVVYLTWLAEKKIMHRKGLKSVRITGTNLLLFLLAVAVSSRVDLGIRSYRDFIVWGVILTAIFGVLTFAFNAAVNRDVFAAFKSILKRKKTSDD